MKSGTIKKIRLFVLCYLNFITSMIASMQTPFYPKEASIKGLVATQFGFVFGIYQIFFCIFSLFFGNYMSYIGVSVVNITGLFLMGITCILFGFVSLMYDSHFYIFSLLIRLLEGIGTAAFVTSSLAIISTEFTEHLNLASSFFLSCYGAGLVIGPAVGGFLYELGGFVMPFTLIGVIILISSSIFAVTLRVSNDCLGIERLSVLSFIKYPYIILGCAIMFCEYFTIGFLDAHLEPHLRPLGLNSFEIGLMFLTLGFTFSASSPIWGYICDKWSQPKLVCMVGCFVSSVMFLLIGPTPFLPLELSVYIVAPVLFLLGFALGAVAIGTYSSIRLDCVRFNILKPTDSNGLISGIWICSAGLGSFSGSTFGGILFDTIGFPWTSFIIATFHFTTMLITLSCIIVCERIYKS